MKEKLIYKNEDTTIEKVFEDKNSDEFLKLCIDLMLMLWYSEENITKSMDEFTF